MFSLIGVPLTSGFFGKFYIFQAALDSHLVWLTIIGLLNSAIAAYYYLKIIVAVYMREPADAVAQVAAGVAGLADCTLGECAGRFAPRHFPVHTAVVRFVLGCSDPVGKVQKYFVRSADTPHPEQPGMFVRNFFMLQAPGARMGTNTARKPAASAGLISDFGEFPIIQVRSGWHAALGRKLPISRYILFLHDCHMMEVIPKTRTIQLQPLFFRIALRKQRQIVARTRADPVFPTTPGNSSIGRFKMAYAYSLTASRSRSEMSRSAKRR